jgi:hypothetical protein
LSELELNEFFELTEFSFFFLLLRSSASGEGGQNLVALCGWRGIGIFCRSAGQAGAKQRGKLSQPVVLHALQGKGSVRQRSLIKKSAFCYFLAQQKVRGLCGQEQTSCYVHKSMA